MTGGNLISTTVPTLVGMHVVSKTTDTMFGKKRKRKATARVTKAKSKGSVRKIHVGERGGKYIMKKGRRVYI